VAESPAGQCPCKTAWMLHTPAKSVGQWTQMQTFGWKNWSACVDGLMRPWEVSGLGKVHLSFLSLAGLIDFSVFPPVFHCVHRCFHDFIVDNLAMECHLHLWFSLISPCLKGISSGEYPRVNCGSSPWMSIMFRWLLRTLDSLTFPDHENHDIKPRKVNKVGITPS
jgi:hypothetical protein